MVAAMYATIVLTEMATNTVGGISVRFFMPASDNEGSHEIAQSWYMMLQNYRARTLPYESKPIAYMVWVMKENDNAT